MAKKSTRDPTKPWAEGAVCDVYWNESYEKDFRSSKTDPDSAAKVEATLKRIYCKTGADNMPGGAQRLNTNEGRYNIDGRNIRVWAFKNFQLRVYGVEGSVHGKRAFFASEVQPKKKRDGADRAQLKRAAKRALELAEAINGARL